MPNSHIWYPGAFHLGIVNLAAIFGDLGGMVVGNEADRIVIGTSPFSRTPAS